MKILVTGAKGMVGTALVNNLKNLRDGKNRTRPDLTITDIYNYRYHVQRPQIPQESLNRASRA